MGMVHEKKEQKDGKEASEEATEKETKTVCKSWPIQKTFIWDQLYNEQEKEIFKSSYKTASFENKGKEVNHNHFLLSYAFKNFYL